MLPQHLPLFTLVGLLALWSGEFCAARAMRSVLGGEERGPPPPHPPGPSSSLGGAAPREQVPGTGLSLPALPLPRSLVSSHPSWCSGCPSSPTHPLTRTHLRRPRVRVAPCGVGQRRPPPLTEPPHLAPSPRPEVYQVQGQQLPGLRGVGSRLCLVPEAGKSRLRLRPPRAPTPGPPFPPSHPPCRAPSLCLWSCWHPGAPTPLFPGGRGGGGAGTAQGHGTVRGTGRLGPTPGAAPGEADPCSVPPAQARAPTTDHRPRGDTQGSGRNFQERSCGRFCVGTLTPPLRFFVFMFYP